MTDKIIEAEVTKGGVIVVTPNPPPDPIDEGKFGTKIPTAEIINKKPVVMFVCYDDKNAEHARKFKNSLRKFHSEEELPLIEICGEELQNYLKVDPMFFYRQKPIIAEKLIKEYECVIGCDVDQIVVGDLSYIWKTKDYDVGTVINYNRADAQNYPLVAGWGIFPVEYFNCGLVAMRSEAFVKDWKNKCFSPQFDRMQYKEQDLLNALCYFGNYNVRCFDHTDPVGGNNSWWGIFSKGELSRAKLVNGEMIIPQGEGPTPFPPKEVSLKVIHFGGGNDPQKGNYRIMCSQEIVEHLDKLVADPVKDKSGK